MIADFFTKPLQGTMFRKFRTQIMNLDPLSDSSQDDRSVLWKEVDSKEDEQSTDENGWIEVHHKTKTRKRKQ